MIISNQLGGHFSGPPEELQGHLTPEAKKLIEKAFQGIDLKCLTDYHVHVAAIHPFHKEDNHSEIEKSENQSETIFNSEPNSPWVNPNSMTWKNPAHFLKLKVYMSASGLKDAHLPAMTPQDSKAINDGYLTRLASLIKNGFPEGKFYLLAFDKHYDENGNAVSALTNFYIPNNYVVERSPSFSSNFVPVISIHPARADALSELEKYAKMGVKIIKWLPNAMRIDPSLSKYDAFYEMVKKYDMAILTHVGEERAVDGEEYQILGNPLLLRRPLDMGVKIIMAHAASLGDCQDLDNDNKQASCFELFWRLFDSPKYEKNLLGEISGMTIHTRVGEPIYRLLSRPDLHHRLINGSDYPLPAVNFIYRTSQWQKEGLISKEERADLNLIYAYNPLLFDFVSKRILKHPKSGQQFDSKVFQSHPMLGGCSR